MSRKRPGSTVLFGWTFLEAEPKRGYLIAQLDGQDAAGIGQLAVTNDRARRFLTGTPTSQSKTSIKPLPA